MNSDRHVTLQFALMLLGVAFWVLGPSKAAAQPIPLIFDTDIGNDVDDVLALGVIHALESRGECNLLAVTITKDSPLAAAFTDAINTFYGRGNIPIGVCHSGKMPDPGKFNPLAEIKDGSEYRYPHDLLTGEDAPDAVQLLRKTLAGAEDGTVVFVQVGFSTNLANLLDSKPDKVSPLSGLELVTKKARLLSIMAGAFQKIEGPNGPFDHKEFNILIDIPAAQKVARRWPTPIVWSGFEIGLAIRYPHESIESDYQYVEHHPLADAYINYIPPPHDRPTFDLTSVLYAVRPARGYFTLSPKGTVRIADDSLTTFQESTDGRHQYLTVSEQQKVRVAEALAALSSQPPTATTHD